jgi:hypothetical protein
MIDTTQLKIHIGALRAAFPEIGDDEQLLLDMLEGETDYIRVVDHLINYRQEAVERIAGINARKDELAIRKGRFEGRIERVDGMLMEIMQAANLRKLPTDEVTIAVVKKPDRVEVVNLDAIPQGYFRLEKTADKRAILNALKEGEMIPGTELVQGSDGLRIQTK